MKKVMCFGTFDLVHLGHIRYFQQAKGFGDYLIVVIARDATKHDQKKNIIFSEEERLELIKNIHLVDEAVLGNEEDHLKIVEEKKPDIICLGYDHLFKEKELAERLAQRGLYPEIKRMKPYQVERHKTSIIRKKVLTEN